MSFPLPKGLKNNAEHSATVSKSRNIFSARVSQAIKFTGLEANNQNGCNMSIEKSPGSHFYDKLGNRGSSTPSTLTEDLVLS